jgi:hypothetical protein
VSGYEAFFNKPLQAHNRIGLGSTPSRRPSIFQVSIGTIVLRLNDGTRRGTLESNVT